MQWFESCCRVRHTTDYRLPITAYRIQMTKILTVLGARPQFIKAATVSREHKKAGIQEVMVHTGQHFDHNMSSVFFQEMEIPHPNYNLEISGLNHGAMTGRMMEKIEEVILL